MGHNGLKVPGTQPPLLLPAGYGHTVPLSDWGKVICIFYAFLGIPLTLGLLACLLRHLLPLVSFRPVQYVHRRWGFPVGHVALIHAAALGLATVSLFILLPAVCFWRLEGNWNFLESVYFCFISLSTIGLGDYVPRGSSRPPLHELYELSITCKSPGGVAARQRGGEGEPRGRDLGREPRFPNCGPGGELRCVPKPPEQPR